MNSEKVSMRIKKYMKLRDLSLEELAERTGMNKEFLQSMIDEEIYPPLGPLLKIARALGLRLGTFLDDQDSSDPLIIRREDTGGELNVAAGKNKAPSLKFYSLGRGKTDRHMEPFHVELMPESAENKKLSSHEGEEFIVVKSGSIEVLHGKEKAVLNEGDSIYYNSVVPHYVSCAGDVKAEIYAVLYVPE